VSLLRPFFPEGWAPCPGLWGEENKGFRYWQNEAAFAWEQAGELEEASACLLAPPRGQLTERTARLLCALFMLHISDNLRAQNRVSQEDRCLLWVSTIGHSNR